MDPICLSPSPFTSYHLHPLLPFVDSHQHISILSVCHRVCLLLVLVQVTASWVLSRSNLVWMWMKYVWIPEATTLEWRSLLCFHVVIIFSYHVFGPLINRQILHTYIHMICAMYSIFCAVVPLGSWLTMIWYIGFYYLRSKRNNNNK